MRILLDTSVMIDTLRKRYQRREFLANLVAAQHTLATTVLNVAELRAGMRPNEKEAIELFLGRLVCLEVNERVTRRGGELKYAWSKTRQIPGTRGCVDRCRGN